MTCSPFLLLPALTRRFAAISTRTWPHRRDRISYPSVIRGPVRIAPWWTAILEVIHAVFPGALQWVFTISHDPFHMLMRKRLEHTERRSRDSG